MKGEKPETYVIFPLAKFWTEHFTPFSIVAILDVGYTVVVVGYSVNDSFYICRKLVCGWEDGV